MKLKRLISLLTVLALCFCLLPVTAAAAESGTCGENVTWTLSDKGVLTISGTGPMANYDSDSWDHGAPWYPLVEYIKTVVIKDGVTSIGDCAFYCCYSMTSVTIPDSVTSIGESAFDSCLKLTTVDLPNSITSIGDFAFFSCGALKNVTIGSNITSIGDWAFAACMLLESIYVSENNACYSSDSHGVLFNKEKTELIQAPGAYQGSYSIPDTVTSIGDVAFYWCIALTDVTIPSRVTYIDNFTFAHCFALTKIFFHGSAPYIGFDAFSDVTATAYYPPDDPTWTSDVKQNYGGTLTWLPYGAEEPQPDAPTIKASNVASTGKIKVTWDAVEGAKEYQVYRATSKTGTYKLMKTTTKTSYSNTSVDAGKTYYYYVLAVNADGKTSEKSNIASRTCDLAQPVISTSNVASSGKIKVSWEAIDGAVEYEVYRATSKTGTYKLMKTTTSTSYTNTGAEAGKTYYDKVKAIASKSSADSAYSEVKSRTCDLPRPDVSIALSSGKPKVSWKAVEGAVEYEVYRATSKDGTYKLMKTTTKTSYANTSATAGKTYYYKVVAVASKSSANSAYSSVVSIKSK